MSIGPIRGGAPVGFVEELGPVEAGAVLYLRLWSDGPSGQTTMFHGLTDAFGLDEGRRLMNTFGDLVLLCAQEGRRRLMRHRVGCPCLGGDESCFANFVGYAAEGLHDDAMFIAATFLIPHSCPRAVALANEFGMALGRMKHQPVLPAATTPAPAMVQ
ncbi:MAG: hypothetical protein MK160_04060 [Rhodobacteraceae bacterium]|nr:hypothetical protein [Paracoccaceae bacterium]